MPTNDENFEVVRGYWLHIFLDGGHWQVWLNTEVADFDGLCIGSGRTREAAIKDAQRVLISARSRLTL